MPELQFAKRFRRRETAAARVKAWRSKCGRYLVEEFDHTVSLPKTFYAVLLREDGGQELIVPPPPRKRLGERPKLRQRKTPRVYFHTRAAAIAACRAHARRQELLKRAAVVPVRPFVRKAR